MCACVCACVCGGGDFGCGRCGVITKFPMSGMTLATIVFCMLNVSFDRTFIIFSVLLQSNLL